MSYRRCWIRIRNNLRFYIYLTLFFGFILGFALLKAVPRLEPLSNELFGSLTTTTTPSAPVVLSPERKREALANREVNRNKPGANVAELRMKWLKERIERSSKKVKKNNKLLVSFRPCPHEYL